MPDAPNDNEAEGPSTTGAGSDAHGQAAMLLVESLIHGLVARSVLSVAEAIEIVNIAAEVNAEIAADLGDTPQSLAKSLTLLQAITNSLAHDLPDGYRR